MCVQLCLSLQLHPFLFRPCGLPGLPVPALDHGLATVCFTGSIETAVLHTVSPNYLYFIVISLVCQTWTPSAMQYYGDKGSSHNLCKLGSLVFGQNITQIPQPILLYSLHHRWATFSRLAIYKLSLLTVYQELSPDSNDDSLQDLLVSFVDKPAFLKCTPCVPCCSYLVLGPVMHGALVLCAGT